jgi:hypothetical protein
MFSKKCFILLTLALLASGATAVETKSDVTAKLQKVALFKNGLGFFVAEADLPAGKESVTVGPFAAASHGTFWTAYAPTLNIHSLIANETEIEEVQPVLNIPDLLHANIGKHATIVLSGDPQTSLHGIILSCPKYEPPSSPSPYEPGQSVNPNYNRGYYNPAADMVLLKTERGYSAVRPNSILNVDFLEKNINQSYAKKKKAYQLRVQRAANAPQGNMTISYLAKGITWAPSYRVDISDNRKAQIAAKAAIINEVADLKNLEVELVTGFPNLRYSDIMSPLAKKEDLAKFLEALSKGESERGRDRRSVLTQQRASYGGMGGSMGGGGIMPEYGAAKVGAVAEDMFFYPVDNVRLKKDQTGYYPLFTAAVKYRHIHQWEIPDYVEAEDRYNSRNRDQAKEEEIVWHSIRLENFLKLPWTTAPAEVIKDDQLLGQDILNYTPTGAETDLRITRAVSVKAEQIEYETDRKRDAARFYGYHYDLVTVSGELEVKNFKPKPITLEITKYLSGELKSSGPQALVSKLARGLRRANPRNKLTWTIELKAGEQRKLHYTYEVYIRR